MSSLDVIYYLKNPLNLCTVHMSWQVCGGSQSFNVVNTLRNLGRWMRMFTIPNQSSIPKAWTEFDEVIGVFKLQARIF